MNFKNIKFVSIKKENSREYQQDENIFEDLNEIHENDLLKRFKSEKFHVLGKFDHYKRKVWIIYKRHLFI